MYIKFKTMFIRLQFIMNYNFEAIIFQYHDYSEVDKSSIE